jgi:hypothetical protein
VVVGQGKECTMNVTPEEHAELRMLLLEVCDAESGLTAWKVEFIDSLCERRVAS